jgi:hypothetical protein
MRFFVVKLLIVLAVVLLLLIIGAQMTVTRAIRKQLISFFNESCGSCTLSLDRVNLSILPFSVILEGVHLSGGDPSTTKVDVEVERIVARSSFRNLLSRNLHFKDIQVRAPHVVVTEGNLPVPPSGPEEGTRRTCVIESIEVAAGRFTYIRVFGSGKEARRAILHVKDIQASVGELGTTPQMRDRMVHGLAKGRLESSGGFLLTVEAAPFFKVLKVDVDLQMTEQNLVDMSPFFETTDGIRLGGKLHKGRSLVKVRERKLTGWVQVQYDGLDVKYEETKSRGKISAFFSNLVNSIKLHPSSMGKNPADQTRDIELMREPREALIHFILRGMKEGALKVAGGA